MRPTKPLLSPNYVLSFKTDLKRTFARIKREQAEAKKKESADDLERIIKVKAIR